jgi:hypothetical protein
MDHCNNHGNGKNKAFRFFFTPVDAALCPHLADPKQKRQRERCDQRLRRPQPEERVPTRPALRPELIRNLALIVLGERGLQPQLGAVGKFAWHPLVGI